MTSQSTSSVSLPVGCYHPWPPSPFIIITLYESWYLFYRPMEGGRLSLTGHCCKGDWIVKRQKTLWDLILCRFVQTHFCQFLVEKWRIFYIPSPRVLPSPVCIGGRKIAAECLTVNFPIPRQFQHCRWWYWWCELACCVSETTTGAGSVTSRRHVTSTCSGRGLPCARLHHANWGVAGRATTQNWGLTPTMWG